MRIRSIALLCFFGALSGQEYAYFIPPKGWDLADPAKLSPRVKIAFVGKDKNKFCPTINLAVEAVNLSIHAYLAAVKKIHEADPNTSWRDLGRFLTSAGEARLTELLAKTEWGDVRLLQLILIKKGMAYIVTASALKSEFSQFYLQFNAAFRSFALTADLIEDIPKIEQKEVFKTLLSRLKREFKEEEELYLRSQENLSNYLTRLFSPLSLQKGVTTRACRQLIKRKDSKEILMGFFDAKRRQCEVHMAKRGNEKNRENSSKITLKQLTTGPRAMNDSFIKKSWLPFQNTVIHDYSDMGAYWQILVLQSIQEKLLEDKYR